MSEAFSDLGRCQLGDRRRTRRLVETAGRIAGHPDGTLPEKLHDPAAYRAALRLFNHPGVTHAAVLRPHRELTLQRMRQCRRPLLIVHDTTELDYSGQATLSSLGQIGNGGGRGYECHNSLAVDPATGVLVGLACQQLHCRGRAPAKEGVAASRGRAGRESRLWVNAAEQIGPAPDGCYWIDVCDRGADTFEFLEHEVRSGRHFVVRSTHSRALEVTRGQAPHLLHDLLRGLEPQIGWEVDVPANKRQPARRARVMCAWAGVVVRAPHVRRGEHGRAPLRLSAVRVWEVGAPASVGEPLEWVLLTDEAIAGAAGARERVSWYEHRPRVEEYHKAQKTGLGVEQLQLQSQAGLGPAIALLSVLAVALVNGREAARDETQAHRPAAEWFDPAEVEVLSVWRYREVRPLTVREYVLAVARLGGHLNRKGDGLPGWRTIWRGVAKLRAMVEYQLARDRCGKL
jgi:hypothetical protein